MALTRKMLKAMELDDDKISQIIDAHQSTIDEIAQERDTFKADAEKYKAEADRLGSVEKDLVKAQAKLEDAKSTSEELKALQDEYTKYRADVSAKASQAQKEKIFRALLAEAGISDKRFDSIIRVSDLSNIEIGEDGKAKDSDSIVEGIKSEWADFIVTEGKQGADVSKPPANDPKKAFNKDDIRKMSAKEINENWDSIKDSLGQI